MAAQAIIMAGGEGVRLRPLTVNLPKPLAPLLGDATMGYALQLLKKHGITDVSATLCYQPEKIRAAFGRGEKWGVKLRYYEERTPLGTAGSIRMAKEKIKDTFFVLSGDGLTDCDLTAALQFHRQKKALATMVLRRVSHPLSYGVVLKDGEDRVTRFIEKPTWSRVFSDLVNTGIYILEPEIFDHIPESGTPDFGKDIFPALLQKGLPLYGYETEAYWCDIGDQQAYLEAQMALLRGETALEHPGGIHESARIHPSARLEGMCLIGAGAVIEEGAVLHDAVIGEKCVIGRGARIENACLWKHAAVQEGGRLSGCVLCDYAVVRKGAYVPSGCALGQGASVGAYGELYPGVRIWPRLKTLPGAVIDRSVKTGDHTVPQWTERGADCETPEDACALSAAFARVTGAKQVLMGHCRAGALQSVAAGALAAAGVRVLSGGEMTLPMLRYLVPALKMGGGVFASGQLLCFLDDKGELLSSREIKAMDSCMQKRDMAPPFVRTASIIRFSGAEDIYLSGIVSGMETKYLWSPVAVFCDAPAVRRLAEEALERMGARDFRVLPVNKAELRDQETGFLISETGEDLTVFSGEISLSAEQKILLLLRLCREKNGKIYDGKGVPRAAGRMAPLQEGDGSAAWQMQKSLTGDALAGMIALCGALREGPLSLHLSSLPETYIRSRDFPCRAQDKGRILHTLCDQVTLPHTLDEGIGITHEKGYATVVPDPYRGIVRVTGESADSEFASELCDFYLDAIRHMTGSERNDTTTS